MILPKTLNPLHWYWTLTIWHNVTSILASDWLRVIMCPGYWPLISRDKIHKALTLSQCSGFGSHQLLPGMEILGGYWQVQGSHGQASDWSKLITWPGHWPLIGQYVSHVIMLRARPRPRSPGSRHVNIKLVYAKHETSLAWETDPEQIRDEQGLGGTRSREWHSFYWNEWVSIIDGSVFAYSNQNGYYIVKILEYVEINLINA